MIKVIKISKFKIIWNFNSKDINVLERVKSCLIAPKSAVENTELTRDLNTSIDATKPCSHATLNKFEAGVTTFNKTQSNR